MEAYREHLRNQVFRTGMTMKPVFDRARLDPKRVVYAEGEEEKVLQVVQQVLDQRIARPIPIGRRDVIERRVAKLGLSMKLDRDVELVDPDDHPDYFDYCDAYYDKVSRKGMSPIEAHYFVRHNSTVLAALMVTQGKADAMICGSRGRYLNHLEFIEQVVGRAEGVERLTSLTTLVLHTGILFITDAYVQNEPDAEALAEIVRLCSEEVRWFGQEPRAALLSASNFGTQNTPSAVKMREALALIREQMPDLQVEGEMHSDMAITQAALQARFPDSKLTDAANLLVMPNQDAANIAYNLLKVVGDGITIGPLLVGAAHSAHIVTPSTTVRGLLNMTALAVVKAG